MGIVASARVRLTWPLDAALAAGSYYQVFGDGGDGSIDYGSPLNAMPIEARKDLVSAAALGYGGGGYGRGGYGHGGSLMRFDTDALPDCRHKLAVIAYDQADNPAAAVETAIAVAGVPEPPRELAAGAYAGGVLSMTFDLSDDDEG